MTLAVLPPQPHDRQVPDLLEGAGGRAAREGAAAARGRAPRSGGAARAADGARRAPAALVTRKLARAEDDGYRNALVPGLRATADAERLASALLIAAERLEPPGPYEVVATEPDREQASWLAFLLALVGPDAPELQEAVAAAAPRVRPTASCPTCRAIQRRTVAAYRQWAAARGLPGRRLHRRGRLVAAAPLRARVRAPRAPRHEPRRALRAARRRSAPPACTTLAPDQLQLGAEDDATTQAAKRILLSGDKMLLERRARDLAAACDVPLAALDRALALWGDPARGDRARRRAPRRDALRPRAAVSAAARQAAGRRERRAAARARVPGARRRSPTCCPPGRPTTRGRGSPGGARSPNGTSTRARARRGSRCPSCSRRRSRWPATARRPSCGW